jgi:hypothetical protein
VLGGGLCRNGCFGFGQTLMSLYEQQLQISQVTVSAFHVDGDENGNIAIEKTGKFMKALAIDYSIPLA